MINSYCVNNNSSGRENEIFPLIDYIKLICTELVPVFDAYLYAVYDQQIPFGLCNI